MTACVLQQALESAHHEHVKSTDSNTDPNPGRLVQCSAGYSTVQVLVPCPALAPHHTHDCTIYPFCHLPASYPVIDEACTLVVHVLPLQLCAVDIGSTNSPPSRAFSNLEVDQSHDQQNAIVEDAWWCSCWPN